MFPSILIQWENGSNEFYFYFTNKNGNILQGAVIGGNLIILAAVEKKKRKKHKLIELQYCTGMSRRETKKYNLKIYLLFFFNFPKNGSGGSVKRKIKNGLMVLLLHFVRVTVVLHKPVV